jgi:hypothetical protein
LLGIPTKVNPTNTKPMNIHREEVKLELLNEILEVKAFRKESLIETNCRFCDPDKPDEVFKGTKGKLKKHFRTKHGRRMCELCD